MESSFTPFSFINKLEPAEWHALQGIGHRDIYKKGSYIFRANELNDSLYVLLDGRIKITRLSQHGRELIQWFCLPGEIFGLSVDDNSRQRGLYATAISDAKLLCIPKCDFDQYILQHPRIALLIIKQLASRLRTLGDTLLNITSDGAHIRFIKLLQRLSKFYGREHGGEVYIDLYLTHQEMADMIGVCRQTVSSMIGRMKKHGIIASTRDGICIQSPVEFQQLSEQPDNYLQHYL
ncbi:MAG: Crp/Fnr family transcriptional regulator [Gammaproteobacteria bacterium]|nr:Crp/Fnr family transcriptional regulator [Gammaproteobacteria bacterium]MDH5777158.1 Crp/Fnr family transcriptional regulator [Gammaproteobacteria bacterium]